jgi:two-component sensor histidine kinase
MAFHELTTNAVKYGSLSGHAGMVRVDWHLDGPPEAQHLHLRWREQGGPPVTPPTRTGFGSRLVRRGLASELGGMVDLRFEPEGLVCVIDAPMRSEAGSAA